MTDFVITSGRSASYPTKYYAAQFTGGRATFCLDQDFAGFDANVLAIPNLPVSPLTASPVTVGASFFGAHIKYRANDGQTECSIGAVRSHDMENGKSRWQFIQPTSSTWDFADLDSWVNTHYAAGRDLVFTLFGTPAWASARPSEDNAYSVGGVTSNRGIAAEPSDLTKWDVYCTTVATRYNGKIKYYEVWNEPNYHNDGTGPGANTDCFFTGTFATLSQMVRRANQAIKAVDPTAKIICPATTSWTGTASGTAETYLTGMLSASDGATGTMKNWIDIVGVHLYISGNDITQMSGMIDRVKAAMTTAGVSGKEIWDTESAPISPDVSGMGAAASKLFIARSMIIQAAKGIARTFYFQYDDPTMGIKQIAQIVNSREVSRGILMGTRIQSAYIFTDGGVGYYAPDGLSII